MKPMIRRLQELTARKPACLAVTVAAVIVAGCASEPRPMVVGMTPTLPAINEYCANAQKEVAASRVPARNVMMTDYQAFSRASPSVKPLETMQFTVFADDNRTRPRMISCKLHSSARIRAEYGATAAGEPSSCARLNRRTLDAVMASLTEKQKKKMPFKGPVPVMLDPDLQAANESEWLENFAMVQTDAGGTLRIRAKSFGAAAGPVRTGTRAASNGNGNRVYCHLIAPDYLKRILIGEVKLPAAEFADGKRTASR